MKDKWLQVETRIYEILGVRFFRILVFKLEKLVHRKDKGININYHIASYNPMSLETFVKYLFYNGTIHVRNLAYFCIYTVLRIFFFGSFRWYDAVIILFAVKDAYCVMLQRYNYIRVQKKRQRLQQKQEARIERKVEKAKKHFLEVYDKSFAEDDMAVILDMKQRIARGESIVIGDAEQKTLQRLAMALKLNTEE